MEHNAGNNGEKKASEDDEYFILSLRD